MLNLDDIIEYDEESTNLDFKKEEYVLNTITYKFHYQSYSSVKQMKEKSKAFHTGTCDKVVEVGYTPCDGCNLHI